MVDFKCKNCGASLNSALAKNGVLECSYCQSVFTVPKQAASPAVLNCLRTGEHELDIGEFDKAYESFKKAAEYDKNEPEAYWGMALAEFKIQYLKDEVNNCLRPICFDIGNKTFSDNINVFKAIRYGTNDQRNEYERKIEEIDYIIKEFAKIAKSGLDYDCFICVKVSDEDGSRTKDYKVADDIYFALKKKGFKPFFSERELDDVAGVDYEARILYALHVSKCMLVVCFNEDYLRTKWVKNEYSRFLKLINDEEKESDSIALIYGTAPIENLPGKRGKIQGISFNNLSAMERIVAFISNHTKKQSKLMSLPQVDSPEINMEDFRIEDGELIEYIGSDVDVVIPNIVKRIGDKAFDGCNGIASITIPTSVTSIGAEAFNDCSGLSSIFIPNSVTKIEEEFPFSGCSGLHEITFPARFKSNVNRFFTGYAQITNYEGYSWCYESFEKYGFDLNFYEIKNNVFNFYRGCSRNFVIPDNIQVIGENAFKDCSSLESINIPNRTTNIEQFAFIGCSRLKSIIIPESVTSIGYGAFIDCKNITIYCCADKAPDGWAKGWDKKKGSILGGKHKVIWGYRKY